MKKEIQEQVLKHVDLADLTYYQKVLDEMEKVETNQRQS